MDTKTVSRKELNKAPKTVQLAVEVNGDTFIESFDCTKGVIIAINNGSTITVKELCTPKFKKEVATVLLKLLTKNEQNLAITPIIADRLGGR